MPWLTNKETGGHFNTDWIEEEKTKERQINANKEQAAVRNSQDREYKINSEYDISDDDDFVKINRSEISPSMYKNNEYSHWLADSLKEYADQDLYEFYGKSGTALVHLADRSSSIELDTLASSGGKAGTEALLRVMEYSIASNKELSWSADHDEANSYYSHLGLSKYGKHTGTAVDGKSKFIKYNISPVQLKEELTRLRKKYPKK